MGGTGEPWAEEVHSSRAKARVALQRPSFLGNHPFFSLDLHTEVVQVGCFPVCNSFTVSNYTVWLFFLFQKTSPTPQSLETLERSENEQCEF